MRKLSLLRRNQKMPDESGKIIKFPEVPKDPKVLYHCKACDHKITDVMINKDEDKSKSR